MHDDNCFITLTYNEKHLPHDGSLDKTHFQKFMKKLRKTTENKIRYYQCGEYGDKLTRPHYHAILFGHDFADKVLNGPCNGNDLYISDNLEKIWGKGYCTVGAMTFESAAYCARYAMKKITGDDAHKHYETLNVETGELHQLQSEYTTMSRRPGLGYTWYKKYKDDLFPEDECVIAGKILKPPRYYATLYELEEPELYEQLKKKRQQHFQKHKNDSTWQRLQQREKVKHAQINQLSRPLETPHET